MPYKKKSYKKKPSRRQTKSTKKTVQLVKKLIKKAPETKELRTYYADTMNTSIAVDHTSMCKYEYAFNTVAGYQENQHLGNGIHALGIKLDLAFNVSNTSPNNVWGIRVFVVRLNKGTDVNITGIAATRYNNFFQNGSWADSYPDSTKFQLTQIPNTSVMTVVHDSQHYLAGSDATGHGQGAVLHLKKYIKVNKKLNFKGLGSADLETPYFVVLMACNIDNHTDTDAFSVTGYVRSFYKDA